MHISGSNNKFTFHYMKTHFFMFIVGLADIVDAIKNYVTGAPVNGIGVLLFVVVFLYFLELAREKS